MELVLKRSGGGKWAFRFGGIVLIGLGVLPWLFVSGPFSDRHLQTRWPTVQGNVLNTGLRCGPCSDDRWNLIVVFGYELEDSPYIGEQEWFVGTGTPELPVGSRPPDAALAEKLRYPRKAAVPVHYNPADHSQAVVKLGAVSATSIEFMTLGFILAVIGALAIFFSGKLSTQEATDQPPF